MATHVSRWRRRLAALTLSAALTGCAVYHEPSPQPVAQSKHMKVPPGHMPPPGQCRVWYPDRPPGHQPPSGPCGTLQYQVPPGAILVHG